jgi:hypothetical protein
MSRRVEEPKNRIPTVLMSGNNPCIHQRIFNEPCQNKQGDTHTFSEQSVFEFCEGNQKNLGTPMFRKEERTCLALVV